MPTSTRKIVGLSVALAALSGPAVLATPADASDAAMQKAEDAAGQRQTLKIAIGEELMAFTVGDGADGTVVADHSSHASHASHASHSSHVSSR
jgi:hypothetical protein